MANGAHQDTPSPVISEHNVIKLANSLFSFVRSGEKQITIRKGLRNYTLGYARIEPTDNNGEWDPEIVFISSLSCKAVNQVTEEEARDDGFRNWCDLLEGLRTYYPGLTETDMVTIIRFAMGEDAADA